VRVRYLIILVLIAFAGAISFSVTGQEEQQPLPAVTPRGVTISLPIEPVVEFHQPTLAEAARINDYVTFDALYTEARKRGQSVAVYETLHELWTWSMNDPIGAFYGPDLYQRLSRAYPGYAEFIEQYRIIDSNGNAFYPTSETRAFLLARAMEGRAARVMVAERTTQTAPATARRQLAGRTAGSLPAPAPKTAPAGSRRPDRQAAGAPKVATVAPAPAPTPDPIITEPPVVITPAPAPAPAPVTIAEAAPVQQQPVSVPSPPAEPQPKNNLAGRGLLLVIIGLIGVGLLAVILRTPPEEDTVTPRSR